MLVAKGLVAELEPSHALGVWGFKGKRVRVARLAAYCNYLLKKKKKKEKSGGCFDSLLI